MKKDYLINKLFKTDEHTGKKSLSPLGWCCALVVVFLMFGLSMNNKTSKKGEYEKKNFINKGEILNVIREEKEKHKEDQLIQKQFEEVVVEKDDEPFIVPITVIDHTDKQLFQAIPYGSIVQCILINRIVSNNFSAPVVAQVIEPFYFNNVLLLPKGTRIYGEAKKGIEDDRVLVVFHRIVFQSGKEVSIGARGLSEDLSGGLQATIITNETKQRVVARIMNFLGGTLLGLQENVTNTLTGVSQVESNSRNALLEGGAKAFDEEAKRIEASIERAKGKGVVPEGTRIFVFFDEKVEVDG